MTGKPILVMLIEDNIDHAELVIRTMEEHRIANKVRHFLDGQSALDYLFHRGKFAEVTENQQPQLILLDLRLPRVDGIEVLQAVKEDQELKRIPVVVLTTSEAEKDVARAYYSSRQQLFGQTRGVRGFQKSDGRYWVLLAGR